MRTTMKGLLAVPALVACLPVLNASAAQDLQITPVGPVTFSAARVSLVDALTGSDIGCSSVLRGQAGNDLVINGADFNGCEGPAGITFTISVSVPWGFWMSSYDSTSDSVRGEFTGVKATLHGSDECDATISGPGGGAGTIDLSYSNITGILTLGGGDLVVNTADADCDPGLVNGGDAVSLQGPYNSNPKLTMRPGQPER
ncbi:hypothetical protein J4573_12750 [Actinomadura barringtoniae]|uniref:DUF3060 domain-containing protein n=1 Tax=Actinomadura barringtoniae TaxID=1427535 RepID=A0A939P8T9_9ACTN|nr:hypothetical protein [Actinomadura barringtoniae]MBO2447965.1 hypothetical protein [Actinomadura barringtoniae]